MDKKEAQALLTEQLGAYRARSYADLVACIGEVGSVEIASSSGRPYQVEINVLWDDRPGGDVRAPSAVVEEMRAGRFPSRVAAFPSTSSASERRLTSWLRMRDGVLLS
jgi:hypothetical protein